jgi:hypothetical protein
MSYRHLLKARFSPQNACYAEDGAVLSVLPRKKVPQRQYVRHHFVAVNDLKTKSRFGWVAEVPEFTIEEFIQQYHGGSSDLVLMEHVKRMLDSASKVPVGTSMATDYAERKFPSRRMEFIVYRVIFHD